MASATFDLTPQIAALHNGQTGFNVSFHASLNDADFDTNPLALSYQNTVAHQQTIYARIENVLLETCYDTTTIRTDRHRFATSDQPDT
jgi:hypothetical protein